MALSNTATPKYYGQFRDAVIRGEIPVNEKISMEMNRIDDLIDDPDIYYDDKAVEGWIKYCEHYYPTELDHLSTCKSPMQMQGAVIKSYYAEKNGIIEKADRFQVKFISTLLPIKRFCSLWMVLMKSREYCENTSENLIVMYSVRILWRTSLEPFN